MEQLSITIITKNEEDHLAGCLETVRGLGEIIVVDSGSADHTLDICRKFGAKVFSQDWSGFGPQKNYAIDQASGVWILSLDADERITPQLKEEIQQAMQSSEYDGYYIARKNYFGRKWIKHCGWYPDYNLRLFRRGKARFEDNNVHERVILTKRVGYLKNPLIHLTYKNTRDYLQKMAFFTGLQARDMRERKVKIKLLPSFSLLLRFVRVYNKRDKEKEASEEFISLRTQVKRELFSYPLITVYPLAKFFFMYVVKRGFLDGFYGLWLSLLSAYYEILVVLKFWRMGTK